MARESILNIVNANRIMIISPDGTNRSMIFDLPLKKNSKGIQVLSIKRFLDISFDQGDLFDEKTKTLLTKWQKQNKDRIMEIAGWSDDA